MKSFFSFLLEDSEDVIFFDENVRGIASEGPNLLLLSMTFISLDLEFTGKVITYLNWTLL